jgi:hypothetical protein
MEKIERVGNFTEPVGGGMIDGNDKNLKKELEEATDFFLDITRRVVVGLADGPEHERLDLILWGCCLLEVNFLSRQ